MNNHNDYAQAAVFLDLPTYYDFFAGAGLVRLALEGRWRCVWANDIDARKVEVYAAQFGAGEFLLGDVAEVDAEMLPPNAVMAWASFPCQDLSLAGWQRGMTAERSGAFWPFWKIMRDLLAAGDRPPLVVIENVPGMLYGESFRGLCEAVAGLGLQFGPVALDAKWFLPQSRARVFLVALDSRVDCSAFIDPSPEGKPWFPKSIWSAWRSGPASSKDLWRWWSLPAPVAAVPRVECLIEDEPEGVKWNSAEETERLLGMMTPRNLAKVNKARESGRDTVGFVYKRIRDRIQRAEARFDGLAGCLRTPEGGSSRQTVLVIRDGEVRSRLVSPKEAARLMGAPDTFWLPESYNDAYRAMGDGVAVPVVRWLSDTLLIPLMEASLGYGPAIRGGVDFASDDRVISSQQAAEDRAAQWEGANL